MAMKNCEYFEVLLPNGAQKYGLIEDIKLDGDGYINIAPFDHPGLGAQIDFELIRHKTLEILR